LKPNGQFVISDPNGNPIWGTEFEDPEDPSLINPILVINNDGSVSVDTPDEGPVWNNGEPEDTPNTNPDPFLEPHIVPPYYPKNASEIAGPCGEFLI
jgi:hypothetical protein